jgi:hypothetical protein
MRLRYLTLFYIQDMSNQHIHLIIWNLKDIKEIVQSLPSNYPIFESSTKLNH